MRVKIVTKIVQFYVVISKNWTIKTKTVFCILLGHHLFHCYPEHAKCSPFTLTHAARWQHHC